MAQVKILRSRGANLVVVADGRLLFVPTGPVNQWNRKITRRIRSATARLAPSNSRPRWAHYGPPLKRTIRATTDSNPSTLQAHAAVGSTAHYSAFVDQGTGEYVGNGSYEATLLPPWLPRYRYYEKAPWRKPRMIRGQEGQEFFDGGLRSALRSVGMPTAEIPGEPPGNPFRSFPNHLLGFIGSTPWSLAFDAQRNQWRKDWAEWWADERKRKAREASNKKWREWDRKVSPTIEKKRELAAARQAKWRKNNPDANKIARRKQDEQRKKIRKAKRNPTVADKDIKSAQQRVANVLRRMGITPNRVRNIQIKPDGTFTFDFRNARGIWVQRSSEWK